MTNGNTKTFKIRNKKRGSTLAITVTDKFRGSRFDAMNAMVREITYYYLDLGRTEDICSMLRIMLEIAESRSASSTQT